MSCEDSAVGVASRGPLPEAGWPGGVRGLPLSGGPDLSPTRCCRHPVHRTHHQRGRHVQPSCLPDDQTSVESSEFSDCPGGDERHAADRTNHRHSGSIRTSKTRTPHRFVLVGQADFSRSSALVPPWCLQVGYSHRSTSSEWPTFHNPAQSPSATGGSCPFGSGAYTLHWCHIETWKVEPRTSYIATEYCLIG